VAFNKRQREWFLRVYGHRCAFYEFKDNGWVRCKATSSLQVHHIVPVRFSKKWLPKFSRDACLNGIVLCKRHHGWIHPDMTKAYSTYRVNNNSFNDMISERDILVARGDIYWNCRWDWQLKRVCKKMVHSYLYHNPRHPFPQ